MQFFLEWLHTRLRERGWPKTEGLFRKKQYITEWALVEALQDLIRISLGLGCCLPDSAKRIAITCMSVDESTNQGDVEKWIDSASARGEEKVAALSDVSPGWLRLCSLTLSDNQGNVCHKVWEGEADKYDFDEALSPQGLVPTAVSLAMISMCWALRHPEDAIAALNDWSDEQRNELLGMFSEAVDGAEQTLDELTDTNHESWVNMAQNSVNIFSDKIGLPDFDNPATWRN